MMRSNCATQWNHTCALRRSVLAHVLDGWSVFHPYRMLLHVGQTRPSCRSWYRVLYGREAASDLRLKISRAERRSGMPNMFICATSCASSVQLLQSDLPRELFFLCIFCSVFAAEPLLWLICVHVLSISSVAVSLS